MNNVCLETKKIFPKPIRAKYRNTRGFDLLIPSEPYRVAFGSTNALLTIEYQNGVILLRPMEDRQ